MGVENYFIHLKNKNNEYEKALTDASDVQLRLIRSIDAMIEKESIMAATNGKLIFFE